jgi:hypothetical protein
MIMSGRPRTTTAPPVGTQLAVWTVADNEIRTSFTPSHPDGLLGVRLVCPNNHNYEVSYYNLKAGYCRPYCVDCPWECRYCGSTDTANIMKVRNGIQRMKCKRCAAASLHHIPWPVYVEWVARGCFICGSKDRLHIDHDHKCCDRKSASCGKCARGVLCMGHNIVVGLLEHADPRLPSYIHGDVDQELDALRSYLHRVPDERDHDHELQS